MATHPFPELLPPRWVLPGARLGSCGAWRTPADRPRLWPPAGARDEHFQNSRCRPSGRAPATCAAEEKWPLVLRKHVFGSDLV